MRIRANSGTRITFILGVIFEIFGVISLISIPFVSNTGFEDDWFLPLVLGISFSLFGLIFILMGVLSPKYFVEISTYSIKYYKGDELLWELYWSSIESVKFIKGYYDSNGGNSRPSELAFSTKSGEEFRCIYNFKLCEEVNKIHKVENLV